MEKITSMSVLDEFDNSFTIETSQMNNKPDSNEEHNIAVICFTECTSGEHVQVHVDDTAERIDTLTKTEPNDNETLGLNTSYNSHSDSNHGLDNETTELKECQPQEYNGNSMMQDADIDERLNLAENETFIMEVSDHSDCEVHYEDNSNVWIETFCETVAPSDGDASVHIDGQSGFAILEHGQSVICHVCLEKFSNENELKDHIQEHAFEGIHKCKICDKQYIGLHRLKEHMQFHKRTYTCQLCKESFLSQEELDFHKHDDYQTGHIHNKSALKKRKQCLDSIARHRRKQHKTIKAISAKAKTASNKQKSVISTLKQGKKVNRKMHKSEKIKLTSKTSKKMLGNKQKTKKIESSKESSTNFLIGNLQSNDENLNTFKKPKTIHKCEYCNKLCRSLSTLKEHLISHTGIKPFSCETCGKSFIRQKTLRDHMSTHEEKTLRDHMSTHEEKTLRDHMSTHEEKTLRDHMSTHEEKTLRDHMSTHEEKTLRDHMSTHEEKNDVLVVNGETNAIDSAAKETEHTTDTGDIVNGEQISENKQSNNGGKQRL